MEKESCQIDYLAQFVEAVAGHDWSAHGALFLLLDGAHLPTMSLWLQRQGAEIEWVSLVGAAAGATLLEVSPVLVRLPVHSSDKFLHRLLNDPACHRAASLLISRKSLSELAGHLARHLYIEDPDGMRWVLAVWDPFILSSLVGLRSAASALVPGPILTPPQSASLLAPVACWGFKDREGNRCSIRLFSAADEAVDLPFVLTQAQMDQLADISLPDQVLRVLNEAQPAIVNSLSASVLHEISCNAILYCRKQGHDTLAAYCTAAFEILEQITV